MEIEIDPLGLEGSSARASPGRGRSRVGFPLFPKKEGPEKEIRGRGSISATEGPLPEPRGSKIPPNPKDSENPSFVSGAHEKAIADRLILSKFSWILKPNPRSPYFSSNPKEFDPPSERSNFCESAEPFGTKIGPFVGELP